MQAIKLHARRLFSFLHRSDGSLAQRAVRSGFWIGVSSGVVNLLTVLRQVALARLLTPEIFGLMSLCMIVVRGTQIASAPGFQAALIQRRDDFEVARDTAFTMLVVRGFLLAGFIMLISPWVAAYYERDALEPLLQALSLSFVLDSFRNINTVALHKQLNFKLISYMEQSVAAVSTLIVIGLAWYLRSVWALVIGHIFTAFAQSLMSYIYVPGRPRFHFNGKIAKELFGYGKFITGLSVVLFVASEIDNAVIGKLLGVEVLGFYFIAYLLANLPATHISKIASKVLFPAYAQLQTNLPALREAYQLVVRLVASVALPAAAGLMALAPELLGVVYGEKWLPAAVPLQVLALFGAVRSVVSLNGYLLNGIGKPNVNFYVVCARLVLILVLIYPFTVKWGMLGTALAVLIPICLQLVLSLLVLRHYIGLSLRAQLAAVAPWVLYSGLMAGALIYVKQYVPTDLLNLLLLVVLGMLIYALFALRRIREMLARVRQGLVPRNKKQ